MKAKASPSAVLGFFFGVGSYFVLLYLKTDNASMLSIMAGMLFGVLLFSFLFVYGKILDKRYAEYEKDRTSPVIYKTNGNFRLPNGKIRNANIYFCEDGISLISVDETPQIIEEIPMCNIYKLQCVDFYCNIHTHDGKLLAVTIPDIKTVSEKLSENGWIT